MDMEESPVGESESNGMVERAIQEVQGQIRTMRAAWESRYGRQMTGTVQVLPWMVRHAGNLYSRFTVGANEKTPYWRVKRAKLQCGTRRFRGMRVVFEARNCGNAQSGSKMGKRSMVWHQGHVNGAFDRY